MIKNKFYYKKSDNSDQYLVSCIAKCIINFNKKEDIYKFYKFNNNCNNFDKKTFESSENKDNFEIKQDFNGNDIFLINNVVVEEQIFFSKLEKQAKQNEK